MAGSSQVISNWIQILLYLFKLIEIMGNIVFIEFIYQKINEFWIFIRVYTFSAKFAYFSLHFEGFPLETLFIFNLYRL